MSKDDDDSADGLECSCGHTLPDDIQRHHIERSERPICPFCAAPMYATRAYTAEWDDGKKHYQVKLNIPISRFSSDEERLIKLMPSTIARHSKCSCGDTLALKNHTIRKIGEELEFEGTYVCVSCAAGSKTFVGKLKRAVSKIWKDTKKVELGYTGVKYEKDSSEEK